MKLKKSLIIGLAATLMVALTACGGDDSTDATTEETIQGDVDTIETDALDNDDTLDNDDAEDDDLSGNVDDNEDTEDDNLTGVGTDEEETDETDEDDVNDDDSDEDETE